MNLHPMSSSTATELEVIQGDARSS